MCGTLCRYATIELQLLSLPPNPLLTVFLSFERPFDGVAEYSIKGGAWPDGKLQLLTLAEPEIVVEFAHFESPRQLELEELLVRALNSGRQQDIARTLEEKLTLYEDTKAGSLIGRKDCLRLIALAAGYNPKTRIVYAKAKEQRLLRGVQFGNVFIAIDSVTEFRISGLTYIDAESVELIPGAPIFPHAAMRVLPEIVSCAPFPPVQTEPYALKLVFSNGEMIKKVMLYAYYDVDPPVFEYDGHLFDGKTFSAVTLQNGNIIFPNECIIAGADAYMSGKPYSEPTACPEVLVETDEISLKRSFRWKNATIRHEGSLLCAHWGGERSWGGIEGYRSLCNENGRISSLDFRDVHYANEGLYKVLMGEPEQVIWGYGYVDQHLNLKIRPEYRIGGEFCNGFAVATTIEQNKKVLMDKNGTLITIKPAATSKSEGYYAIIGNFHEGLCRVSVADYEHSLAYCCDSWKEPGIWGYIDEKGREVVPPQFVFAFDFINGYAVAAKGKWVIVNEKEQYWTENERWGLIDHDGNEVVPFVYDEIYDISESSQFFCAHHGGWPGGKWGVLDNHGNWVIMPKYDHELYTVEYGYLEIFEEDKTYDDISQDKSLIGLFDLENRVQALDAHFQDIRVIDRKFAIVKLPNRKNRQLIDLQNGGRPIAEYANIEYSCGLCLIWNADKEFKQYGIMNMDGEILIWTEYELTGILHRAIAIYRQENHKGLMDFSGNLLTKAEFDEVFSGCGNTIITKKNEKFGIISSAGIELLPNHYNYLSIDGNGVIVTHLQQDSEVLTLRRHSPIL